MLNNAFDREKLRIFSHLKDKEIELNRKQILLKKRKNPILLNSNNESLENLFIHNQYGNRKIVFTRFCLLWSRMWLISISSYVIIFILQARINWIFLFTPFHFVGIEFRSFRIVKTEILNFCWSENLRNKECEMVRFKWQTPTNSIEFKFLPNIFFHMKSWIHSNFRIFIYACDFAQWKTRRHHVTMSL